MKIINRFEIPYYQFISEQGKVLTETPLLNEEMCVALYRLMVFVRVFDTKAIALQRTGKLGTYPSTKGQEAVFVGVGKALEPNDLFVPYYRDVGTLIQRGITPAQILAYWGGDERGNIASNQDFPYCVPVGSQPLYAAGAAFAMKYKNEPNAVLVMCGEGATSQGDFYEAMNAAGIWGLPIVFAVCNNQWAISVPRDAQTKAKTIAQKAIAAGFEGEQVDGSDIIAVVDRTKAALEKARKNNEPTLLEMVCYRQSDHTTADDASRYEPKALRETEWSKEPIGRLKRFLEEKQWWNDSLEEKLLSESAKEVETVVQEYFNMKPQPLTAMFDNLYEVLPECYQDQYAILQEMEKERKEGGEGKHHG